MSAKGSLSVVAAPGVAVFWQPSDTNNEGMSPAPAAKARCRPRRELSVVILGPSRIRGWLLHRAEAGTHPVVRYPTTHLSKAKGNGELLVSDRGTPARLAQ